MNRYFIVPVSVFFIIICLLIFYLQFINQDWKFIAPKENLPFGFKVNAFENIPENNPIDSDSNYNGYPTERYGTCADRFNPKVFKKFVEKKLKDGATLLGGCCEIKPSHIKAISELIS